MRAQIETDPHRRIINNLPLKVEIQARSAFPIHINLMREAVADEINEREGQHQISDLAADSVVATPT